MTEQELQELNKKLAEWAGIGKERVFVPDPDDYPEHRLILASEHYPQFTQSLDACFKWLVVNLQFETITIVPITGTQRELDSIQKWGCRILQKGWEKSTSAIGDSQNPALALCLAIEKLIDAGKE